MTLKNNKGITRNFEILLEIERKNKRYIIYKDLGTGNIYAGINEDNKLLPLTDNEYDYLNDIIKRIEKRSD